MSQAATAADTATTQKAVATPMHNAYTQLMVLGASMHAVQSEFERHGFSNDGHWCA